MQAEWTLQVEQRIEQLRMAFSLLDIEGMVSLYILSNENGSLGRKVREQGTPVLVQGEVGAAHSVATRGLEVTGARPSDSRAAIILFVERIIGNFVRDMGKGKVFPLEFCHSGLLTHPLPPIPPLAEPPLVLLLAVLGVSSALPPGFQQHPAETILKLEVFMRPSCMFRRPPA